MLLLPEMIGSLAVVALLASVYGAIRARMDDLRAQIALGTAFGVVAMFQMNAPLEMVPGVILDMRNVPVALAGAFLGWRGALLCLAIAAGTRLSIGGIGMPSGVVGMMIACAAGYFWNHWTRRSTRRGIMPFLALSALVSTHMLAAFLLPWDICVAFFASAALPMAGLNFLSIPVAAAFLEQERIRMRAEDALTAGITRDQVSGMARLAEFQREAIALARCDNNGLIAGLMIVRIVGRRQIAKDLGRHSFGQLQGAMRLRLQAIDNTGVPIAVAEDDRIVIALDFRQTAEAGRMATEVRRVLNDHAYELKDGTHLRVSVSIDIECTPTAAALEEALERLAIGKLRMPDRENSPSRTETAAGLPKVMAGKTSGAIIAAGEPQQERLFAAANVLFATKDAN